MHADVANYSAERRARLVRREGLRSDNVRRRFPVPVPDKNEAAGIEWLRFLLVADKPDRVECFCHQEMGRRPHQPADRARWFAKADVALRSNKAASVGPPDLEGFVISGIDISNFDRSRIPRETIEAYLATDYRIWGDWPLLLRVEQRSAELAALFEARNVTSAAVVTAWNPRSEPRPDAENQTAQARLISDIEQLALRHQPGHGAGPTGSWPPEPSRLVLGIDPISARSLGRKYRQNGIVWAGADAVPTLVLLC